MSGDYEVNSYMALQMSELKEHKYYLSEKVGHDIGMMKTLDDWVESGHAERYHDTYEKHKEIIYQICKTECDYVCGGLDECILGTKRIHELLED